MTRLPPHGAPAAPMAPLCRAWAVAMLCLTPALSASADALAPTQRVDGARLVSAARASLVAMAAPGVTVEAGPSAGRAPGPVIVPAGALELHARPDGAAWAPAMRVVVELRVDGHLARRVPVWLAVRALAEGPVAAHDLASGTRVSPADLRAGSIDLAAAQLARVDDAARLAGQRLKRSVRQGDPVTARAVEDPPEVERGVPVVVEFASGGISITSAGVALADARTGQPVALRLPRQSAPLVATVVGPQRARVTEEATR